MESNEEGYPSCAVGGVIRDHEGQPILAYGELIVKTQSVTMAELLVIQVGLKVARQHNIQIHQITSDSLLAVQAVTRPEEDLSYVGSIAADISILMEALESPHLFHVRRLANRVAHSVAAFAFSSSSHFVWEHGSFPLRLIKLVIADLSSS
ncbi:uncharacterized protein LOC142554347 [Primulina tabacum]|uniref:uncharacterized protein LOC142554347 n=1 Tax=Primulina tabacum TaxID=48773 RepID=UPI003F5A3FD4